MSLIERIEAGTREDEAELLREAWEAINGAAAGIIADDDRYLDWQTFDDLLNIGTGSACLGAAMMLVPKGWWLGGLAYIPLDFRNEPIDREWSADIAGPVTWVTFDDFPEPRYDCESGIAATPALALAAACLKAQGADDE